MSRFHDIEPELEEILRKLAADPDAKLMRVPAARSFVGMMNEGPVNASSVALNRAERHLLLTYREELADLLRQRCVMEFFAMPDGDVRWHKSLSAKEELVVPDRESWTERATVVTEFDLGQSDGDRAARETLDACVSGTEGEVGITQLARASLRAVDSDFARVYVALDLLRMQRVSEAAAVYRQVIETASNSRILSYCWEGLGVIDSLNSDMEAAVLCYRKSFDADDSRVVPLLNRLVAAAALGERGELASAASDVDAGTRSGDSVVSWIVQYTKDNLEHGTLRLQADSRKLVRRMLETVGPPSRRVLNEFV